MVLSRGARLEPVDVRGRRRRARRRRGVLSAAVISIYFASGWRRGTDAHSARDRARWACCAGSFSGRHPSDEAARPSRGPASTRACSPIRSSGATPSSSPASSSPSATSQAWTAVYVTDVYIATTGIRRQRGGRRRWRARDDRRTRCSAAGVGVPLAGKLSDLLVRRGWPRIVAVIGVARVDDRPVRVVVHAGHRAVAAGDHRGAARHVGQLLSAGCGGGVGDVRPGQTASVMGFVNMVAQLVGATSLAASGYLGIALAGGAAIRWPNIRASGLSVIPVTLTAVIGAGIFLSMRSRARALAVAAAR